MYLRTNWPDASRAKKVIASPNRGNGATFGDELGDLESLLDLALSTCCDGLLNEHGNAGEVLLDLHLDITARLESASEHGG